MRARGLRAAGVESLWTLSILSLLLLEKQVRQLISNASEAVLCIGAAPSWYQSQHNEPYSGPTQKELAGCLRERMLKSVGWAHHDLKAEHSGKVLLIQLTMVPPS